MKKILVTGSTGLLGRNLVRHLRACGHYIVTLARSEKAEFQMDLTNREKVIELFDHIQPEIIVNLAGLTNVELCQEKINEAYLANTQTVENLVHWIRKPAVDCHLIQISSDHLYDGKGPHLEDCVTLTNNYAFSKYSGELAASLLPSTILRTNFIGLSKTANRKSMTDWVYSSLKNNKSIKVFDDVYFSPLSIATLSEMIDLVIEQKPVGIFNLGSRNGMSKADFDFEFAKCLGLQTNTMSRVSIDEVTFIKTRRPKDMRMNSRKFEEMFKLTLPDLTDEIKRAARDYHE